MGELDLPSCLHSLSQNVFQLFAGALNCWKTRMCWSLIRSQGSASWGTLSWKKQEEQEARGVVPVGCEQFQAVLSQTRLDWQGMAGGMCCRGKGCLGVASAAPELRGIP